MNHDSKTCEMCDLCHWRTQVVRPEGTAQTKMMLVDDVIWLDEDASGSPIASYVGREVTEPALSEAGIPRDRIYHTNILRCKPLKRGSPDPKHIESCTKWLLDDIADIRPKVIVAMGKYAAAYFLEGLFDGEVPITMRRGSVIHWKHPDDPTIKVDVVISYSPSYVAWGGGVYTMDGRRFILDLQTAVRLLRDESQSIPSNTGTRTRKKYRPEREYVNGYHVSDQIHLIYRDAQGIKRKEQFKYPHYFLIRREDIKPGNKDVLNRLIKEGVPVKGKRNEVVRIAKLEVDPEIDSWVRVYTLPVVNWASKQFKLGLHPEIGRRYTTISPYLPLSRALEAMGIRTFEADIDPLRRFMTDFEINISLKPKKAWIDIETDDETMAGSKIAEVIGKVPILSIAVVDEQGRKAYMSARSRSAHHEAELLRWLFVKILPHFDIVYAWNGENFDYPFIWERAWTLGLNAICSDTIWWDQMVSYEKHHLWDAEGKGGLSLDAVAKKHVGEGKVEKKGRTYVEQWEKYPEHHRLYNEEDTVRTKQVEEATGYCGSDLHMNAISNNFAYNIYPALRVDGLALIEGYHRGTHFPTKYIGDGGDDKYTGAYVLAPVPGVYHKVANFDFSSLYPSMMSTFNISPDTYVPKDERKGDETRLPVFQLDDGEVVGGTTFQKEPKGIFSTIYRVAADNRAIWKKKMKTIEPNTPAYFDAKRHEYCWKQLGLSMYGTLGSVYSRYYNRDVAEAVTLSAQYMMRISIGLAERMGAIPRYGDTDSVFLEVKDEKDIEEFITKAHELYEFATRRFNCPTNEVELEHEQTFSFIVLLKKKRYFGHLIFQKGQKADALEFKGLEMRRSDGCAYAKDLQKRVIDKIIVENGRVTWEWILRLLTRERQLCIDGKLKGEQLKTSATLTQDPSRYKVKQFHVRLAEEAIQKGNEVYVGTRMSWVVQDNRPQHRKASLIEEYEEGTYDRVYYWNEKILPPIARIIAVMFPDSFEEKQWRVRRPRGKKEKGPQLVGANDGKKRTEAKTVKKKTPIKGKLGP